MIEQFRNELEQRLNNLQSTFKSASIQEITKQLEDLYERALVAEVLEARTQQKANVLARVAAVVSEAPAPTPIFSAPQEEVTKAPEEKAPQASNPYPLNPEIKVLAAPEGPPMPSHSHHEDELNQQEEAPEPVAEVAPPPPPAPPRRPISDPEPVAVKPAPKPAPVVQAVAAPAKPAQSIAEKAQQGQKQTSLHQRLAAKNLSFGLNDRIAYIKHLFEGSTEDFNRVVNQLNTYESWQEADEFIQTMVKPDYNWSSKEEYEVRFVAQIKARFEA